MRRLAGLGAIAGGIVYAIAGAVMAARNLRWFGWAPDANPLFVWLGVGLALVVIGFAVNRGADIRSRGLLGLVVTVASIAGPIILLVSLIIEFAIFGTLITFVAFLSFTLLVHRNKLLPNPDVVLLCIATAASITWNTETASAGLLVVVGLVAAWISYRATLAGLWGARASAAP